MAKNLLKPRLEGASRLLFSPRWWAIVLWMLAAASATFWALKVFYQKSDAAASDAAFASQTFPPEEASRDAEQMQTQITALAEALGARRGGVAEGGDASLEASRFHLLGVLAMGANRQGQAQGVALMVVDGQRPRPYALGASVGEQATLKSLSAKSAVVTTRAGDITLELPPPTLATGGAAASGTPQATPPLPANTSMPAATAPSAVYQPAEMNTPGGSSGFPMGGGVSGPGGGQEVRIPLAPPRAGINW